MDAVIPPRALPRVRDMRSAATDVQSQRATVEASAPHGRAAAPPTDDRYLSLKTLAPYAGLSVRTLRSRLHDPAGPLPYFRIGGKILIKMSDYDAWALRFRQTHSATLSSVVDDVLEGII